MTNFVSPQDTAQMLPGMEYCLFVYDSGTDSLRIVRYGINMYEAEELNDVSTDDIEKIRDKYVAERWTFVDQVWQHHAICVYYERFAEYLEHE